MNKLKPILDIDKFNLLVEQLNVVEMKNATVEDLAVCIDKMAIGYGVEACDFNPGLLLYRGVFYSEQPKLYKDIIYPPEDKAKRNRASAEGEQMFYAASSRKAVFYELNIKPGDKLVLSSWITNNSLLFNNVGYTRSNFERLSSSRLPLNDDVRFGEVNYIVADFLAKTFCQPISEINDYLYKLTIAIAKVHLKDITGNKFSGLFYPTVRFNGDEENFAIIKDTIDKGLLDFDRAEFIEVLDKCENRYKYRIINVAGTIIDESIIWNNPTDKWTVYDDSDELVFVEEHGHIRAYNNSGDIINPD
ncbi:MAG: hypothetical protein JWQ34_356 [Mucilaginibacter sp.]|uniref:hypothetical protein n=1 Tax=Mucilaginibacter sp. TaxID=1882438 RepID=UPI00262E6783|nr:hypothetical protein [Mucilaginibacter sp.]MDB5002131.1 hypothetical protein [Mucilaginibacter sp.]